MRTRTLLLSLIAAGALAGDSVAAPPPPKAAKLVVGVAPATVAGQALTVTVTAVDQRGRRVTGYRGTVRFASSDPLATLPRRFTFTRAAAGSRRFPGVVLRRAGTRSLQVADTRKVALHRTARVRVSAARAAVLQLAAPATADAGQTFGASATATDAFGNALGDVTPTTTFSVTPYGGCTAAACRITAAGAHAVTAVNGAATASRSVIVAAGPLASLTLAAPTKVVAGVTFAAAATAADAFGNALGDVTATTTFAITPDGACDGVSCRVTDDGAHSITATNGGAQTSAPLTVTGGPPAVLTVASPTSAVAGKIFVVTATGVDAFGNALGDVSVRTKFALDPDGACPDGDCKATVAGAHTVRATNGVATGSAPVTIVHGAPLNTIVSAPATVVAGETFGVTAISTDAYGNPIGDVTATHHFTVQPNGSCVGSQCRATVTGPHTVDSAPFAVTLAAPVSLMLYMTNVSLTGTPITAAAYATDEFGNTKDLAGQTLFTMSPEGTCTAQYCTANATGPHTITGVVAGLSDSWDVGIFPPPGGRPGG